MSLFSILSLVLGLLAVTSAIVVPRQGAVIPLSTAQIDSFTPYTHFASTATKSRYVGFDPTLNTVVVGHQGTDTSKIYPIITDLDFFLVPLNQTLFPGTDGLEAHMGFAASHARSALDVLAAVQEALSSHSTVTVTMVGHSLGAALALIDAVYLPLHLPPTTTFKFVGYGMPRVGNPAFAEYLDAHIPDLTHINNKEDPVPVVPGRILGFQHPHGEVHINDSGEWDACPGHDNESTQCSTGDVSDFFEGNTEDHSGPFNGITMGC